MFSTLLTLVLLELVLTSSRDNIYSTERLERAVQDGQELRTLYKEYLATHGHKRPSCEQKNFRLELFLREIKEILELRSNSALTWHAGINFMADMTEPERDHMRATVANTTANTLEGPSNLKIRKVAAPEEFDGWRKGSMIGPIHDQRKESCWAHSSVVVLEAQLAYYTKYFRQLSIQELYDCVYKDGKKFEGSGGHPEDAFEYVTSAGRLGLNADNPETHQYDPRNIIPKQQCSKAKKTANALEGYELSIFGNVGWDGALIEKIVCIGPVSVAIDTKHSKMGKYKGGLFTAQNCKRADHAMTAVGYTKAAFIIKNSWGEEWGEGGYLNFDRNGPVCEIFEKAVYAKLEPIYKRDEKECKLDSFIEY